MNFLGVDFRLEPDQQFAAEIEHRPLDHRRLRQHQGQRLALIEAFSVGIGQFLERGAGAVEQHLPAEFIRPALELVLGDAGGLVIMKLVGDAMAVEPAAGLLHGVAVLDAVDGVGQFCHSLNGARRPRLASYASLHMETIIHQAANAQGGYDPAGCGSAQIHAGSTRSAQSDAPRSRVRRTKASRVA